MRKRSDTQKSPPASSSVGLRSSTRTSAAARRGEERSTPAGKEHSKTTSTVSKPADEKASVITPGTAPTKRSNAKKETPVPAVALLSGTPLPVSSDLEVPETLEGKRDIGSTEMYKEGIGTLPSLPLPETVVSTTNVEPAQSCPEALKVEPELVNASLTRAMEDDPQPIEAGITSTGPAEAVDLSGQEQEKTAKAPAAVEVAANDQETSTEAPASGAEAGELAQDRAENAPMVGAEAGELAQDRAENAPMIGAEAEELAQDKAENAPMIGAEAGVSPEQHQEEVAKTPEISKEGREMSGQEGEVAACVLASGREDSPSIAGGEITPPLKGSVPFSEAKSMDEADCTLRSNSGKSEHGQIVQGLGSNSESSMKPLSVASTVGVHGTRPQEAGANTPANTFSGRACNFLLALEAAKTSDRASNPAKDASSHFHNNMVSSVEGETVLIC